MEELKESWKPVVGYEGLYEVSSTGAIKTIERQKNNNGGNQKVFGGFIKQYLNPNGYYSFVLYKKGVRKTTETHRLVARAFIPNPENKPCVNHINGIKTDNRVENLEWCTISENIKHAWKNNLVKKRFGSETSNSKLSEEEVLKIRKLDKSMKQKDIARMFNVSRSLIGMILQRKRWGHI